MDVLSLISAARAAGLTVSVDGDRLVVEGPSAAAHLARALGRHKADVLVALTTSSTGNGNTTHAKAEDSSGSVTVTTAESPAAILADLRRSGLDLLAEPSGRVILTGPPEAVTALPAELFEAMEVNWPALRRLATPEPMAGLEEIDLPNPCPKCGSLEVWWPIAGSAKCIHCDPPVRGMKLLELAARLRRQRPKPSHEVRA